MIMEDEKSQNLQFEGRLTKKANEGSSHPSLKA